MKITIHLHYDRELWPLIGPHLASREVVKALGGPVFSEDATTWFVAREGRVVVGFIGVRLAKSGYWIDCTYVVPDHRGKGVHTALAGACDVWLAKKPPQPLSVVCRSARWHRYEAIGFQRTRTNGDWITGKKSARTGAE